MQTQVKKHKKLHEWYAAAISFLYFFCVLASYYVIRPVRDQFSAEVGSSQLPWFFAVTFVVTLLLTPIFAWLVSRYPRRILMPAVYLFFIIGQIAFMALFNSPLLSLKTMATVFFVWVSIFNLFVVSVFWSFMTDIWGDLQARRLFPIITLGGSLGAIIGPLITHYLVGIIGITPLLLVSASFLTVSLVCIFLLSRWARRYGVHRNEVNSEEAVGGSMLDGLKQIFNNPFIRNMSVLMLLSDAIGTIGYALVTEYSGTTFPHDAVARTRFAADLDLIANIIQIVLQLTITRWLLVRYGTAMVFAIWTIVSVIVSLSMTFVSDPFAPIIGTFPIVAIVLIITRALAYGMILPARESLYTLVPRTLRYKGKNTVDTCVWRAGDVVSLSSISWLKALGIGASGFGIIGAALIITSGMIGWNLSRRVENS